MVKNLSEKCKDKIQQFINILIRFFIWISAFVSYYFLSKFLIIIAPMKSSKLAEDGGNPTFLINMILFFIWIYGSYWLCSRFKEKRESWMIDKNDTSFYKIGKYKIYIPYQKKTDKLMSLLVETEKKELGYIKNKNLDELSLSTLERKLRSVSDKKIHLIIDKYLEQQYKELKHKFYIRWVVFSLINDEAKANVGDILFLYLKSYRLGTLLYIYPDEGDYKEDESGYLVKTKSATFMIIKKNIISVFGDMNYLEIKTKNNIYCFHRKRVIIDYSDDQIINYELSFMFDD